MILSIKRILNDNMKKNTIDFPSFIGVKRDLDSPDRM